MKNRKYLLGLIGIMFIFGLLVTGCTRETTAPAENNLTENILEERSLSDFIHILEEYRDGVLANRNGEKLRTQIMTFSFAEGNRAFFCTTNDKPLYAQLVEFPHVSFCTFPADWEPVVSLNGKVVFVEDRDLRERALETNYYAKRNFVSADNPLLEVFYIYVEEIETYSFEGAFVFSAKRY